jgi:hypothetical protein
MIADKKRVSVYYQGDTKSKKGWYSIEPIRVDNKNGSNYLLAYSIPKDGGEPSLQYFSQPKIVNWNVLGNKAVTLSKDYEKKLFKFFRDPKVPKEQKLSYADRLKKVGVNVGNFLKKAAVNVAVSGALLMPFKDTVGQFLRDKAPHVMQVLSTRDLHSTDFNDAQRDVIGKLIASAIRDGEDVDKGFVTYDQYRKDIKSDVMSGKMMSGKQVWNQIKQDPEVQVALTLGQFGYEKTDKGNYIVTDKYDFSKWKSINTTKEDIKGLPYPAAIAKIINDNEGANLYTAIRHMAYLENPDDAPNPNPKTVSLMIPSKYVNTYSLASTDAKP